MPIFSPCHYKQTFSGTRQFPKRSKPSLFFRSNIIWFAFHTTTNPNLPNALRTSRCDVSTGNFILSHLSRRCKFRVWVRHLPNDHFFPLIMFNGKPDSTFGIFECLCVNVVLSNDRTLGETQMISYVSVFMTFNDNLRINLNTQAEACGYTAYSIPLRLRRNHSIPSRRTIIAARYCQFHISSSLVCINSFGENLMSAFMSAAIEPAFARS